MAASPGLAGLQFQPNGGNLQLAGGNWWELVGITTRVA